jgi:hypothetical protein
MDYTADSMASQVLNQELTGGERLLWTGKPRQGIYFQTSDAAQTLVAIPFLAFSIFWEWKVTESGSLFMMLWGVPFVLIGLHMLVGRFFTSAWRRRQTYYGLTDKRAIIVTRGMGSSVNSISLSGVAELAFTDGPGTRATITFGPETPVWAFGPRQDTRQSSPRFEQIENGRDVYNQILRLRENRQLTPA